VRVGYRRILYEFIPIQVVRVTPVTLLTSWTVDNAMCIFCGRIGADIKITREHTFSNWINEVLPAAVVGPDITYERSIQHGPQAGTVNTWPAKVVADHTVRAVCKDCNNGWMKRWEDAVAPLIGPMIKGQPAQLTVDQQLAVATWAAMKAAVFEYVWSEDTILTAADVPPPSTPLRSERDVLAAGEPGQPDPQVFPVGRADLAAGHPPGLDAGVVEGDLSPVDIQPAYDGHRDLLKLRSAQHAPHAKCLRSQS
jgi:hypothetical protein